VDDRPRDGGPPRRRASYAERREQRAAVEDVGEVLDAAARYLEARPRSVAEVRRRLTTAGYRAPLVEAAIARLGELGYLDDEAFARSWVESRDRARPRGEHALRRELRLKGIDDATVRRVLDERRRGALEAGGPSGDEDGEPVDVDRAAAERLLARHARALARVVDPRARRQRAYALLARNGFDPSTAAEASRTVLATPADGADEASEDGVGDPLDA
jgi:regulatory protein